MHFACICMRKGRREREGRGEVKKIDRFVLAVAVHCKAEAAAVVRGNLNEKEILLKNFYPELINILYKRTFYLQLMNEARFSPHTIPIPTPDSNILSVAQQFGEHLP